MPDKTTYRDIQGFPGYRVGDDGSVWSCWAFGPQPRVMNSDKWHQLTCSPNSKGYLRVNLCLRGKKVTRFIHCLVLEAFTGPCPKGIQCRHDNGVPSDNRLSNLLWGTPTANQADRIRHGTDIRGEKHRKSKLKERDINEIRRRYESGGCTQTQLADEYGVSRGAIGNIILRRQWKHVA